MARRAAIYVRTSTDEQNPDMQLYELRRYAEARGFEVYREYIDVGQSGARDRRPALDELMRDAFERRFDVVLVWKFDRFARSLKHLVTALEEFRNLGIDFISLKEQVDTTSPAGRLMFHIIAAMAEFERDLIRERVKAGMEAARRRGVRLGRRPADVAPIEVARLWEKGLSFRQIAKRLKTSPATVYRRFKKAVEAGLISPGRGEGVKG